MNVPSNLVAEWVMMIRGGRLREVPAVEWFDLTNFGVSGRRLFMGGGRLREMVAHGGSTVLVYKVSVSRAFFATGCKLNCLISLMSSCDCVIGFFLKYIFFLFKVSLVILILTKARWKRDMMIQSQMAHIQLLWGTVSTVWPFKLYGLPF